MNDYQEYLQSDYWKLFASEAKERVGNRCQLCNSEGSLHVHHRTYERLGEELPDDVTVLCADCHARFHDKINLPSHDMMQDMVKRILREARIKEKSKSDWEYTYGKRAIEAHLGCVSDEMCRIIADYVGV